MKENRYATGVKDSYGNREFDFAKAFTDLKQVVLGKKKFSDDLYEVMYLRFTIAHYSKYGWLSTYSGNWSQLANEINPSHWGDLKVASQEPFDDIKRFLVEHDGNTLVVNHE